MLRWMARAALAGLAAALAALAPQLEPQPPMCVLTAPPERVAVHGDSEITVVLDTSGSMRNRGKLDHARRAIRELNGQLGGHRSPTVVAFSDDARVIVHPDEVLTDAQLTERLSALSAHGSSNTYEGLATARALTRLDGYIVLVTDGVANAGIVDPKRLAGQAESLSRTGGVLSVAILGDSDASTLTHLAAAGGGQQWTPRHPRELSLTSWNNHRSTP